MSELLKTNFYFDHNVRFLAFLMQLEQSEQKTRINENSLTFSNSNLRKNYRSLNYHGLNLPVDDFAFAVASTAALCTLHFDTLFQFIFRDKWLIHYFRVVYVF